ncbi:HAMP domain-containing histidine kinase [Alkalihalobacillus oceani]|uniref:sensor histidine kinase n=1 Tax=Halalkalibacter oceani TaxID=1653776 RepID=UPI00203BC8F5|nr:HAMP domain-containing sensor histidine kinase [Halalkalibacter oceani]MCM3761993.1 HAMP domain-containing histidine kinase [Halalkalibacter oceani]
MFRNREFRYFVLLQVVFSAVAVGVTSFLSLIAAMVIAVATFLLITSNLLYTRWRYREIEKLSRYLRQITAGDYTLDVRDNEEGELSLLKNEIYKVTQMLSEQGNSLARDKGKLTDAISDISHQLKTPLTSMMVMADLLSNSDLSVEKRKEFTHNIRVQLERIEWLVSSLLKLSKIDAGTIHFKKEPIAVRELIRRSTEPLLIPMDIKDQRLKLDSGAEVSLVVDANWTVEALINILKNGVEHTGEGGEIAVSYSDNALYSEIIIADNGKGIAKDDLPYIFKRFYKGKNASDGSIGIGLAMAHSIITSQNGDIEVTSEPGKGTTFMLKFYKTSY